LDTSVLANKSEDEQDELLRDFLNEDPVQAIYIETIKTRLLVRLVNNKDLVEYLKHIENGQTTSYIPPYIEFSDNNILNVQVQPAVNFQSAPDRYKISRVNLQSSKVVSVFH
jgi:hypothetical protein